MAEELVIQNRRKSSPGRRVPAVFVLILGVLVLFLLIFIVVAFGTKGFGVWEDTVCQTRQCIRAASRILEYTDLTVDPCDDFYQFACGGYQKTKVIPPGSPRYGTFDEMSKTLETRLQKLLEKADNDDPDYIKQAKTFYKSCLNETVIDNLGIKPLHDYIKLLGGWTVLDKNLDLSAFNFEDFCVKTGNYSFSGAFQFRMFRMSVGVDPDNSTRHILTLSEASLFMGSSTRESYLKGRDDKLLKAYETLVNTIAQLLGADVNYAKVELDKIINFEIELANLTSKPEDKRESANNSRIATLGEMNTLYKGIDWKKMITTAFKLRGVEVNESVRVKVKGLTFFENIGELIKKTDPKTLAGYIVSRNIMSSLTLLDVETRGVHQKFLAVKTGVDKEVPRVRRCVLATKDLFFLATSKMYVDAHFEGDTAEIVDMAERIKQSFKLRLDSAAWLDVESRQKAREKVDAMISKLAYPEYLKNKDELQQQIAKFGSYTIDPSTYFFNYLNVRRKDSEVHLQTIHEKVDRRLWNEHPVMVNAFYSRSQNAMVYPVGILSPPVFDNGGPKSVNFGSIGQVMGHELTHGFDDGGRLYDKHGNKHEWMTEESIARFNELKKCVIDSYSNITVAQVGKKVNGKLTQGENIADIGSLPEAFYAYQTWVKVNGEEKRLPGLNLAPNQLFFVGFGHQLCMLATDQYVTNMILGASHTPNRERVLGSLINTKEFSQVFNCPVGSKMNPGGHKCQIW